MGKQLGKSRRMAVALLDSAQLELAILQMLTLMAAEQSGCLVDQQHEVILLTGRGEAQLQVATAICAYSGAPHEIRHIKVWHNTTTDEVCIFVLDRTLDGWIPRQQCLVLTQDEADAYILTTTW